MELCGLRSRWSDEAIVFCHAFINLLRLDPIALDIFQKYRFPFMRFYFARSGFFTLNLLPVRKIAYGVPSPIGLPSRLEKLERFVLL